MKTNQKIIAGLIVLILIAGAAYMKFASKKDEAGKPVDTGMTVTTTVPQTTSTTPTTGTQIHIGTTPTASSSVKTFSDYLGVVATSDTASWKKYIDVAGHFSSIAYPANFTVNPNYTDSTFGPGNDISGVRFSIPASLAAGTNLSSDSYVGVYTLPQGSLCDVKRFIASGGGAQSIENVVVDGRVFSVAQGSEPAAGNLYEEIVASPIGGKICTAVKLFIHSSNIHNYDPGTVKEFDRAGLVAIYESMVASYKGN
jgi:hypothetical protein